MAQPFATLIHEILFLPLENLYLLSKASLMRTADVFACVADARNLLYKASAN